jgi:hypothetical protein
MARDKHERLQLVGGLRMKVSSRASNKKHGNNGCGIVHVVIGCKMMAS